LHQFSSWLPENIILEEVLGLTVSKPGNHAKSF
jgi:hypothetical protein